MNACNHGGPRVDRVGRLIAFENGELDNDETIELFQDLVEDGTVWQLQGYYGRMAMSLIEAGHVKLPRET